MSRRRRTRRNPAFLAPRPTTGTVLLEASTPALAQRLYRKMFGVEPPWMEEVEEEEGLHPIPYDSRKKARRNPRLSDVNLFQAILAHLRALQWIAWTSHWTASGPSYYGDHLLLQRLYAGEEGGPDINEQIDQLGERMVAYFGTKSVNPAAISSMTHRILELTDNVASPYARLLVIEKVTQTAIRKAWKANQDSGNEMSLGIDDYLMSLANERDTVRYLLQRRVADPGIYDEGSY